MDNVGESHIETDEEIDIDSLSPSSSKRLKLNERRSVLACIRCRKRKTKCSGEDPCKTCTRAKVTCEYPRKAKRISIYDVEVEQYQAQINKLEKELATLKSKATKNNNAGGTFSKDADISIWLGSAASELICWNLKRFTTKGFNSHSPTLSPDFSTFLEEKTFDFLFTSTYKRLDRDAEIEHLRSITFTQTSALFDAVVSFINMGYLTINPVEFKQRLPSYFHSDGQLNIDLLYQGEDYFIVQILMIMAMGEIYKKKFGNSKRPRQQEEVSEAVPGLKYFRIVLNHLPSTFYFYDHKNLDNTFEVIELLGLVSVYLRFLDKKTLAVLFTIQSLQLCISLNLHKERQLRSREINNYKTDEYLNTIWWSTFCLNRFFSARISQPLLLNLNDISNLSTINSRTPQPATKYEFANETCMEFYIELAKISDKITNQLYKTTKRNSSQFLSSILSIMEVLVNWVENIPQFLKLDLSDIDNLDNNSRVICSLHLNYIHHIYLTTIPILINLVKFRIINFYSFSKLDPTPITLNELPKTINYLISSLITSSQLTMNIFIALYRQEKLSIYGMTDLDYLFSCSLVFLMCILLNCNEDDKKKGKFEDYLQVSMDIMNEMKLNGNSIAHGKLNQIIDLIVSLKKLLTKLGSQGLIEKTKRYKSRSNNNDHQKVGIESSTSLDQVAEKLINSPSSTSSPASINTDDKSQRLHHQSQQFPEKFMYDEWLSPPNDILDCNFLLPSQFSTGDVNTMNLLNINDPIMQGSNTFTYNVTEEDINFMDQFFIDF
ncbi:uncharacterized protein RJT21DRAFT_88544 [Scheffersomyces amazonensis]|uniref:uncharacterized protein n=1 Tax=Scheffersomyces amazonensis TaxID=1078765 RepID=UPI00315DF111